MKKFGFTLAELIIAISIIGVTAVLVAPTVVNLMPDSNKVKVIKYYTQLSSAVNSMLSDENIYRPYSSFENNEDVIQNVFITSGGQSKKVTCNNQGLSCFDDEFPVFLRDRLGLVNDRTVDNAFWDIQRIEGSDVSYSVVITINNDEEACLYGDEDCNINDVNQYRLVIQNNGTIVAGDPLTDAYLRNLLNMNSRKEDIKKANSLIEEGIDYNSRM